MSKIFVYCGSDSHAGRKVAVTNFRRIEGSLFEGWVEEPASRAPSTGPLGSGRPILGDAPAEDGWALDPNAGKSRSRYVLECRKCRRPIPLREETLFEALDGFAGAGMSDLELGLLAARVSGR